MASPLKNNLSIPRLKLLEGPIKSLFTAVIIMMSLGMTGALSQVIIHDIIPTFMDKDSRALKNHQEMEMPSHSLNSARDLFSEMAPLKEKIKTPYYKEEQFVWLLKWTHIHLFSMSMIFIFMGGIAIFLNISPFKRNLLIVLPFIGIVVDISAMWLKTYLSPHFFWLHLPGGGLFIVCFIIVSFKAMVEMWLPFPKGVR